jgi:hypothetical protein
MDEFKIEIKVSAEALEYSSVFADSETIFWLEAVRSTILKNMAERVSYD